MVVLKKELDWNKNECEDTNYQAIPIKSWANGGLYQGGERQVKEIANHEYIQTESINLD